MAGTPVSYTPLVAGDVTDVDVLNTNFNAVNVTLAAGLANTYIAKAYHNVALTWYVDAVPVGTERIGFKVPTALGGNFTLEELQVCVADVGSSGVVNVNIHNGSAFPPTSSTKLMASNIVANTAGHIERGSVFTTAAHSVGDALFIEYVVTVDGVGGLAISLFGKAENRGS
jgi:hypothetical protein